MGIFNNSKDIDIFASSIGAICYTDPKTGLKVFTSFYLKNKKEQCCDSGCRNCPYKSDKESKE